MCHMISGQKGLTIPRLCPGAGARIGGGSAMAFEEILAQVLQVLQHEGRVSYRALKLRFNLDDAYLEALKDEIIEAKQQAVDENGKVLVWTGGAGTTSPGSLPSLQADTALQVVSSPGTQAT